MRPVSLALALVASASLGGAARGDQAPPPQPASPAVAAAQATCTLKTVHATRDGDGAIDPQIKELGEDLRRPPFTAWRTFRLLQSVDQPLGEGLRATFPTPDGRQASLTYGGHLVRDGHHAIKVVLDFQGEKSHTHTAFTLDEGGHFLVAGHRYKGGILIHALSCKTGQ